MTYQAIYLTWTARCCPWILTNSPRGTSIFWPRRPPRMAIEKKRWFRPCGRVWERW